MADDTQAKRQCRIDAVLRASRVVAINLINAAADGPGHGDFIHGGYWQMRCKGKTSFIAGA
jgi:hypothetical protein